MTVKRIICLANSRKMQEYCVAGREITRNGIGPWIRPVSHLPTRALTLTQIAFSNGQCPKPLDIIDIPLRRPLPEGFHSENYLIDQTCCWRRVGALDPTRLQDLVGPVQGLWIDQFHAINGCNDRMPLPWVKAGVQTSLRLVGITSMQLVVGHNQVRADFVFNGTRYCLAVTDPDIEAKFVHRPHGSYAVNQQVFLCISLSEPFGGFVYKLVAGVIGLN